MLSSFGLHNGATFGELLKAWRHARLHAFDHVGARYKNPDAVALGRLGGKKGGLARAEKLSKKRRSEIARTAAQARWHKQLCAECGKYPADSSSSLCAGCEAYREHTAIY